MPCYGIKDKETNKKCWQVNQNNHFRLLKINTLYNPTTSKRKAIPIKFTLTPSASANAPARIIGKRAIVPTIANSKP